MRGFGDNCRQEVLFGGSRDQSLAGRAIKEGVESEFCAYHGTSKDGNCHGSNRKWLP